MQRRNRKRGWNPSQETKRGDKGKKKKKKPGYTLWKVKEKPANWFRERKGWEERERERKREKREYHHRGKEVEAIVCTKKQVPPNMI